MAGIVPSFQDYFDIGVAEAELDRPDLSFDTGDISEMEVAAAAAIADHQTGYLIDRLRATFLDTAEGDDLTTLADDHWGVTRNAAVAATGAVQFSRATDSAGAGSIPEGTEVATAADATGTDVRYVTDDAVTVGASALGPFSVGITASLTGTGGNVAADTIIRITTTGLFDSSFTVTNSSPTAGGTAEEADVDLRERVRGFPATVRRGTLAALEYGAKTVAGVSQATAIEDGFGNVTIYVTDVDGNSSGAMEDAVELELENWRAAGIVTNVSGGSLYDDGNGGGHTNITVALVVRAGVDTQAIASAVKSAIAGAVNKLKIGDTLYTSNIQAAARSVDPDNILEVTVTLPAVSIAPAANEIIRTTADDVTVS